jgi:murein tripeptide amidase MpaA
MVVMTTLVRVDLPLASAMAAALAGVAIGLVARDPAPSTNVAIRVDCTNEVLCAIAESRALDVWSEHAGAGVPRDLVVDSDTLDDLRELGVEYDVLDPDIDATAAAESMRLQFRALHADWFSEFHDYREITEHLRALAEANPERMRMEGVGSSIDAQTIWAWKIGNGSERMMINGTQHAREWISSAVTTCVADRLVNEYATNPKIKQFVDTTTLWVVPVVNPDGYQYSWAGHRFWRKNRRDGHGVDLNRNWGVAWGGSGSSSNKRSEVYRGAKEFSEPESTALRDLAAREKPSLHIDFHAYGQLILYPWNYTAAPAKDRDRFAALGDNITSAIVAQHGKRYTLIQGVELYPSAGTMNDWLYGELGSMSYAIELRPKGGTGFVLPPEEIKPTCDEGLAAVLALRGIR